MSGTTRGSGSLATKLAVSRSELGALARRVNRARDEGRTPNPNDIKQIEQLREDIRYLCARMEDQ